MTRLPIAPAAIASMMLVLAGGCGRTSERASFDELVRKEMAAALEELIHLLVVHNDRYVLVARPFAPRGGEAHIDGISDCALSEASEDYWVERSSDISLLAQELHRGRYDRHAFYVLPLGEGQDDTVAHVKDALREHQCVVWLMCARPAPWEAARERD